jgi:hypothetical protein
MQLHGSQRERRATRAGPTHGETMGRQGSKILLARGGRPEGWWLRLRGPTGAGRLGDGAAT